MCYLRVAAIEEPVVRVRSYRVKGITARGCGAGDCVVLGTVQERRDHNCAGSKGGDELRAQDGRIGVFIGKVCFGSGGNAQAFEFLLPRMQVD